jgi:tetratricopeptide (TPR) repeat protein
MKIRISTLFLLSFLYVFQPLTGFAQQEEKQVHAVSLEGYKVVEHYLLMGNPAQAEKEAAALLAKDPEHPLLNSYHLYALFLQNKTDGLARKASILSSKFHDSPDAMCIAAYIIINSKDAVFNGSDLLERVERVTPDAYRLHLIKGRLLEQKRDYLNAGKEYNKALEQKPDDQEAMLAIINCALNTGNADFAMNTGRHAVNLYPDYPGPHLAIAQSYNSPNDYDNGYGEFLKVLQINPLYPDVYDCFVRFLLKNKKGKEELIRIKQILGSGKPWKDLCYHWGRALYRMENSDQAMEILRLGIDVESRGDADLEKLAAMITYNNRQYKDAISFYSRALLLDDVKPTGWASVDKVLRDLEFIYKLQGSWVGWVLMLGFIVTVFSVYFLRKDSQFHYLYLFYVLMILFFLPGFVLLSIKFNIFPGVGFYSPFLLSSWTVLKIITSGLFIIGIIIVTFLSYPLARTGYGKYLFFFYLMIFIGGMFAASAMKNPMIIVQTLALFVPGMILFFIGIGVMHADQPPAPLPEGACPRCRGHGWYFTTAPLMDGNPRERMRCPDCGGSGQRNRNIGK